MTRKRKFALCGLATVASLFIVAMALFLFGRHAVVKEEEAKWSQKPRTMAEARGLLDNIVSYRQETIPVFVPQSGWDDKLCAADVVGAVNWLLGEKRLRDVPAWWFYATNKDKLVLTYDRSRDFAIKDGHVVETFDRKDMWLARIVKTVGVKEAMTSDRLYVIGYHYHATAVDAKILAAQGRGGTLNSHLMLLLGKADGSWWGYHMFEDNGYSPFRVENLGEFMPEKFDLIYIWEVKNTNLPPKGAGRNLLFVQDSPPYGAVKRLLGHGYLLDTIMIGLFGHGSNFPTVVDLDQSVADVTVGEARREWRGRIRGFYHGIPVRDHVGDSVRGVYGMEFQCVEFVNRYYARALHYRNMSKSGDADTYYYGALGEGLLRFPNYSAEPPRPDDILVFDRDGLGGDPGHVAIVTAVTPAEVCFAQQNAGVWHTCRPLRKVKNNWHVDPLNEDLPCVGWVRKEDKK